MPASATGSPGISREILRDFDIFYDAQLERERNRLNIERAEARRAEAKRRKSLVYRRRFILVNSIKSEFAKLHIQLVDVLKDDPEWCCPICFETSIRDPKMVKLPCQHIFHVPCILKWLVKSRSCPICRRAPFHLAV